MRLAPLTRRIAILAAILALCGHAATAQRRSRSETQAVAQIASGSRVISGTVVSAATGQPLDGADVTLNETRTGALIAETTADTEGRFAFQHLPDGKFSLRATHRGYVASAFQEHEGFSTAIVTGEGLVSTDLKFPLQPQAVLYGTVADESGDPVARAQVALYRQNESKGTESIVHAGEVTSDDLGNYEFPRLSPGNYYLAVSGSPWFAVRPQEGVDSARSPLDVAYATTFYADTTDSDSATPIPVKAGDRIPVNFTLHPVPAVHIKIQISNSEPGGVPQISQLRQNIFGSTSFVPGSTADFSRANDTTTIEIAGVAPGHYDLELRSPRSGSSRDATIDATSGNAVLGDAAIENSTEISGKVAMTGGEALPSGLTINLTATSGDEQRGDLVDSAGNFHIPRVSPGVYEVLAFVPHTAAVVTQMIASGATVDGHLLTVGSVPVTLAATLAEGNATVKGFAKANGKPAPGVMILLVPAHPAGNREMFRRDQSDSDGSFTLYNVIPGEYTLVAIEDGWTLDWAQPGVIEHYLPKGLRVTVPSHSRDIALKESVEVQPK
jgi:5-hydroxyisourate hydrolase-like protein (transthyretin family)